MRLSDMALAVAVAGVWGFSFVVIEVALNDFPPFLLSCLRFVLAAIPAVFFVRFPSEIGWRKIVYVGMILGVIKFSLLFLAIDIGSHAGVAAFVLQSQVYFTIFIAVMFLKERLSAIQLLGLLLGLGGISMLIFSDADIGSELGFTLILLAGFTWAVANIIIKKMGKIQVFPLFVWMSLVPIIPLFLLSIFFEGPQKISVTLSNITVLQIFCLSYLAFASTLFCYAGWGHLLGKYPTNKVTPFALLIPIFGLIGSHIILTEPISIFKLTALVVILLSLILCIFAPVLRRN